jgi:hypothetical protein
MKFTNQSTWILLAAAAVGAFLIISASAQTPAPGPVIIGGNPTVSGGSGAPPNPAITPRPRR